MSSVHRKAQNNPKLGRNNLLEKYMKGQAKKAATKVYEVWPSITVAQLAGTSKVIVRAIF